MHALPAVIALTRPQLRQRLLRLEELRERAVRDARRMGERGDHASEAAAAVIVLRLGEMVTKVERMLGQ